MLYSKNIKIIVEGIEVKNVTAKRLLIEPYLLLCAHINNMGWKKFMVKNVFVIDRDICFICEEFKDID